MPYLRKLKHKTYTFRAFETLETAIGTTSLFLTDEIYEGPIALKGKIVTAMVPTRTLQPADECAQESKKICVDEDDY